MRPVTFAELDAITQEKQQPSLRPVTFEELDRQVILPDKKTVTQQVTQNQPLQFDPSLTNTSQFQMVNTTPTPELGEAVGKLAESLDPRPAFKGITQVAPIQGLQADFPGRRASAILGSNIIQEQLGFQPDYTEYEQLRAQEQQERADVPDASQMGVIAKGLQGTTNIISGITESGIHGGIPGAVVGGIAGAVPTLGSGAIPGALAGGGLGMAANFYLQGAGDIYETLRGYDIEPDTAQKLALAGGIPYAALEKLQLGVLAKPFKKAGGKVFGKAIEKVASNNPTLAATLAKGLKEYGVAVGTETVTEGLQRGVEEGTAAAGMALEGRTEEAIQQAKQIPGYIGQEMKDVAPSMAFLPAPGTAMNIAVESGQVRADQLSQQGADLLEKKQWQDRMRDWGATVDETVQEHKVGENTVRGQAIVKDGRKIIVTDQAEQFAPQTTKQKAAFLESVVVEHTGENQAVAMQGLQDGTPEGVEVAYAYLTDQTRPDGIKPAGTGANVTFQDGSQGDVQALIFLAEPQAAQTVGGTFSHEMFHTVLKNFMKPNEYAVFKRAGMKDGKFNEEQAVQYYLNTAMRQEALAKGVAEKGNILDRTVYRAHQRIKGFTESLFGPDLDSVTRQAASGELFSRGMVDSGQTRGAVQNWQGYQNDEIIQAPEVTPVGETLSEGILTRNPQDYQNVQNVPTEPVDPAEQFKMGTHAKVQKPQQDLKAFREQLREQKQQQRQEEAANITTLPKQEIPAYPRSKPLEEMTRQELIAEGRERGAKEYAKQRKDAGLRWKTTSDIREALQHMDESNVAVNERVQQTDENLKEFQKNVRETGILVPKVMEQGSGRRSMGWQDFGNMGANGRPTGLSRYFRKENARSWDQWLMEAEKLGIIPSAGDADVSTLQEIMTRKHTTTNEMQQSIDDYIKPKQEPAQAKPEPPQDDDFDGFPWERAGYQEESLSDDDVEALFSTADDQTQREHDLLLKQAGGDKDRAWTLYENQLIAAKRRGEEPDAARVATMRGLLLGKGNQGDLFGEAAAEKKPVKRKTYQDKPIQQSLEGLDDGMLFSTAHHGTPHTFAPEKGFPHGRFRLDKMGTGEGAQAYGWGIYFAESRRVGEQYRKNLSGRMLSDSSVASKYEGTFSNDDEFDNHELSIAKIANEVDAPIGERIYEFPDGSQIHVEIDSGNFYASESTGSLYTLDIPDDAIPKMLLWDAPVDVNTLNRIKLQAARSWSDSLQNTFNENIEKGRMANEILYKGEKTDLSGMRVYGIISRILGSDKQASEFLARAGIPGLRFLDQMSRSVQWKSEDFKNKYGDPELIYDLAQNAMRVRNNNVAKAAEFLRQSHYPENHAAANALETEMVLPTYNTVVWDQNLLDRISLLERNGARLDQMQEDVKYSTAREAQPEDAPKAPRKEYPVRYATPKNDRYYDRPKPKDWKERPFYTPGIPEVDKARDEWLKANEEATKERKNYNRLLEENPTASAGSLTDRRLARRNASLKYSTRSGDSNLKPTQQKQVRSDNFKKWFGDWEAAIQREFLEGEPVVRLTGEEFQKSEESLVKRVSQWFKEQYNSVVNSPEIGSVTINARGVRDSQYHGIGSIKASAFAAVPDIIKNGKVLYHEANWKGRKYDGYLLGAPISIAGEHYIGAVVVIKDANTQRFYLHEVGTIKKIQESVKTGALPSRQRTGDPESILSILQNIFRVNPSETSKVVDEEGRPLIVYHGTNEEFTVFDEDSFFTPTKSAASKYGKKVGAYYLSLKNPKVIDYEGKDDNDISFDVEEAKEEGYDGLIVRNTNDGWNYGDQYIAFSPTQIKSATGNSGTFDPDNPDIRYSTTDTAPTIPDDIKKKYMASAFATLQANRQGMDNESYRQAMIARHGKAVEPHLDAFRDIYRTTRKRIIEAVQKSALANPGTTPEAKQMADDVDAQRTKQGKPETRPDMVRDAEAEQMLRDDYEGTRASIQDKGNSGQMLTDSETIAAKQIFNDLARKAVKSGKHEDYEAATQFFDAYRETGSEQARAFRARRVPTTPEERANWLLEYAMQPSVALQKKIDNQRHRRNKQGATAPEKNAAQAQLDKLQGQLARQVERRLNKMIKQGWDLTPEGLQAIAKDDRLTFTYMRDVSTDRASLADKLHEFRLAMMLSAPSTHIVNIVSSQANAAMELSVQRAIEASINTVTGSKGGAQWGEFRYILQGALSPVLWKRAFGNALKSYDIEAQVLNQQISGKSEWGSGWADYHGPAVGGKTGRALRTPLRLLLVEDELQRTLFAGLEVGARAYRIAKKEGLTGQKRKIRIQELVADTTSEAWVQAAKFAERNMFQDSTKTENTLVRLRGEVPGGRWLVPFAKTPLNLFRTGLRKSVGAPVALAHDFATGADADVKLRHAAESIIATLGGYALYCILAGDDDDLPWITGANPTGGRSSLWDKESYVLPTDSIRIGDTYYNYRRIEPFGSALSALVTQVENMRDMKAGKPASETLGASWAQFGRTFAEHPMLTGINDLLEIAENPERNAPRFVTNFTGSFSPNMAKSLVRSKDSLERERRGMSFTDNLKYSIMPSSKAEPKIDIWGREIGKAGNTVTRFLTPYKQTKQVGEDKLEQLDSLIRNWNSKNPNDQFTPSPPSNSFSDNGRKYELTPPQWTDFKQIAGQKAAEILSRRRLNYDAPTKRDKEAIEKALKMGYNYAKRQMIRQLR